MEGWVIGWKARKFCVQTLPKGDLMSDRQFDTLVFCRETYDRITQSMAFRATTRAEAEHWQKQLRPKLVELLGGLPEQQCDLRPESVKTEEFESYRRENVLFQSRENVTVFSYLLLPKDFSQPGPVIICLPGHGRGVDDIVGINEDGTMRTGWGGYQNDFALQSVANGFAALAIEQFGFGHRRDERARKGGAGGSSCNPASGAAFLFGQTMAGWRVYDVIRAIDYLETRPDIDTKRIAVMASQEAALSPSSHPRWKPESKQPSSADTSTLSGTAS